MMYNYSSLKGNSPVIMKITKISRAVSKMDIGEIEQGIKKSITPEEAYPLLQEAYKKDIVSPFYIACQNPVIVNNLQTAKLILNMIERHVTQSIASSAMDFFLYNSSNIDQSIIPKIIGLAHASTPIASVVLLSSKTPNNIIDSIINSMSLNIPSRANMENNSPVLAQIIEDLKKGNQWGNERSGIIMMSRLIQNPRDAFVTEVSKYDISPNVSLALINASKLYQTHNKDLGKNIENNSNTGIELAKIANLDTDPRLILPSLITSIQDKKHPEYISWIWSFIKEKIATSLSTWANEIFNLTYGGEDIISLLLKEIPDIIPELINIVKSLNPETIRDSNAYAELIHLGLDNEKYKDIILSLPEEFFSFVKMTEQNREIVKEHFHPTIQEIEDINRLM